LSGYTSTAAIGLRDALCHEGSAFKMSVHTRILGNVIYFMAALTSKPVHLRAVEEALLEKLDGTAYKIRKTVV
jgi:dethiobiotin synthetase/adenosylmethionine--8-amino-7-oxononanoate aminotransferase